MLMEEMLNNITWTSPGAGQTDIFLNFLAVCDSACTRLIAGSLSFSRQTNL